MGHIALAAPVAHIWFLKSLPSRIGSVLDLTLKEVEKVLYFEQWIVLDPKNTTLKKMELLPEEKYAELRETLGPDAFTASIGAEAMRTLLEEVDLDKVVPNSGRN